MREGQLLRREFVAGMERQQRSGSFVPHGRNSGLRCAPSGLRKLVLPDGQNIQLIGQCARPQIFAFTEFRNRRILRALRPNEEGRIAIVTNAGRTAVDVGHVGAEGFAGRATVSEAAAHTIGVIGVRQNRVVLTPAGWRQALR